MARGRYGLPGLVQASKMVLRCILTKSHSTPGTFVFTPQEPFVLLKLGAQCGSHCRRSAQQRLLSGHRSEARAQSRRGRLGGTAGRGQHCLSLLDLRPGTQLFPRPLRRNALSPEHQQRRLHSSSCFINPYIHACVCIHQHFSHGFAL